MTEELKKKVDRAIKLIQSAAPRGGVIEVSYSGGKDSDVILELTKMAGVKYRAIYKNTTIDPPYTIKHCKDNGVEIVRPKLSFFKLVEKNGFPNRYFRFCCRILKEYKILDKVIIGVRKAESVKREKIYKEPTACLFLGSKKEHVEAIYPILDWSDNDIVEFIEQRNIKLHPLYYREDGSIDAKRRLGCMCCPLAGHKKRLEYFRKFPNMVKAYIRAGNKFRETHPNQKVVTRFNDVYEWFYNDVFCKSQHDFEESKMNLFGKRDYKKEIEEYFNIKLK